MTWTLGGNHDHVDIGWWLDVAEADVEAVTEDEHLASGKVGLDGLGVEVTLLVIWGEDDDDVGLCCRGTRSEHAKALGLCLGA